MRTSWALYGTILAIVLFGISAVTYLTAMDRDPAQVLALLTAIGAPTVIALLALAKGEQNHSVINTVKDQTNGQLTDVQDRVTSLESDKEGP